MRSLPPLLAGALLFLAACPAFSQINISAGTSQITNMRTFNFQTGGGATTVSAAIQLPEIRRTQIKTTVDGSFAGVAPVGIAADDDLAWQPTLHDLATATDTASLCSTGLVYIVENDKTPDVPTWGQGVAMISKYIPFVRITPQQAAEKQIPLPRALQDGRAVVMADVHGNVTWSYTGPISKPVQWNVAENASKMPEKIAALRTKVEKQLATARAVVETGDVRQAVQLLREASQVRGYPAATASQAMLADLVKSGLQQVESAVAGERQAAGSARPVLQQLALDYAGTDAALAARKALAALPAATRAK